MRSLERVVRPFESPRSLSPQRILTPYQQTPENVTLVFGASGSGKVMNGSYQITITSYMDSTFVETEQ